MIIKHLLYAMNINVLLIITITHEVDVITCYVVDERIEAKGIQETCPGATVSELHRHWFQSWSSRRWSIKLCKSLWKAIDSDHRAWERLWTQASEPVKGCGLSDHGALVSAVLGDSKSRSFLQVVYFFLPSWPTWRYWGKRNGENLRVLSF